MGVGRARGLLRKVRDATGDESLSMRTLNKALAYLRREGLIDADAESTTLVRNWLRANISPI